MRRRWSMRRGSSGSRGEKRVGACSSATIPAGRSAGAVEFNPSRGPARGRQGRCSGREKPPQMLEKARFAPKVRTVSVDDDPRHVAPPCLADGSSEQTVAFEKPRLSVLGPYDSGSFRSNGARPKTSHHLITWCKPLKRRESRADLISPGVPFASSGVPFASSGVPMASSGVRLPSSDGPGPSHLRGLWRSFSRLGSSSLQGFDSSHDLERRAP